MNLKKLSNNQLFDMVNELQKKPGAFDIRTANGKKMEKIRIELDRRKELNLI